MINIITQIAGTSGYSNHGRGLSNALGKITDVKIITLIPAGWESRLTDFELEMIRKEDKSDTNIIIDMPHNWNSNAKNKRNIGFLVWEGDTIPLSWLYCIENPRISQVWVPSNHVKNAVFNTTLSKKIRDKIKIVPHGFNPEIFHPIEVEHPFTFLCNKGFRGELDRGGMQHAIYAFLAEFHKGEASLFLKLNPAYTISPEQLHNLILSYVAKLNKPQTDIPEIKYTFDDLTPEQLNGLYNSCDVLVNPTHAEAFSLPSIEAMACGKPVISTNFGGQTDFITNENGWLINYTLKEVKHDIMYEGIRHAEPNIEELRKYMRESQNNAALRLQKGKNAIQTASQWTWDNSAKIALTHLSQQDTAGLS